VQHSELNLPWGELRIAVDLGDNSDEMVARLTPALRSELLLLDVDAVVPAPELPPPGAKSGIGHNIWVLIVSGTFSATTLGAVTQVTKAWLDRARGRTVTVEFGSHKLTLEGASARDQSKLASDWIGAVMGAATSTTDEID